LRIPQYKRQEVRRGGQFQLVKRLTECLAHSGRC
jgi:hypothetical protein